MNSAPILKMDNIQKSFRGNVVLRGLNLSVLPGEIYGFLGQNGAGKTTTLRILLGLLRPDKGTIACFGREVRMFDTDFHESLGVMSENSYIQPGLTVDEYITYFRCLYQHKTKMERIEQLLDALELSSHRHKQAVTLSNGMKKKLSLIRALVNEPKLLVLDEPVSNLDPQSIVQVRKVLLEEKARGCSVLMSSHILAEVEKIADRVGIIHHGIVEAEQTIESLENSIKIDQKYILETTKPVSDTSFLQENPNIVSIEQAGNKLELGLSALAEYQKIAEDLTNHGYIISLANISKPDLEMSFLNVIGEAPHAKQERNPDVQQ